MLIQCTRKLLDQLKIKPEISPEEEPLFSWHANLLVVNRRKMVVLVNDKNRYVIVLYGLKAKDFQRLDEIIIQAIRETFQDECIREDIIEDFIAHSKGFHYTKTKDRSSVAKLNQVCEYAQGFEDLKDTAVINQRAMNMRLSRMLVGDGRQNYINPNEELYKDLETFAGTPVFHCQGLQLKVTLDLIKQPVWRRIVVPANYTFQNLHTVLQEAFGWHDYHLHEFYVLDGDRQVAYLVSAEEGETEEPDFPGDVEKKFENEVRLSEYVSACKRLKYIYDFGDSWEHYIEFEKKIDEYNVNYPVCLEGEGNTPPEDVGGTLGYEEFLSILADEKHPEHREMVNWGKSQGYRDFNMEDVNRMLKRYGDRCLSPPYQLIRYI